MTPEQKKAEIRKLCPAIGDSDPLVDRNCQPPMLAVMSEEQKWELVCNHFGQIGRPCVEVFEVKILELPQPTFADLWLEVMKKDNL